MAKKTQHETTKHTVVERIESHELIVSREDVLRALRWATNVGIPEDAKVFLEASGCYCDSTPELSDEDPLRLKWTITQREEKEGE